VSRERGLAVAPPNAGRHRAARPEAPEAAGGADTAMASGDFARLIDGRVAARIRQRRQALGMTQKQLAKIVGVAFQQTHKYEHGLSRVTAGRLYQLAGALGAPITYFFAADGDPARPADGSEHEAREIRP
jgi:DNA-binding XRE family transcriptional regulator